MFKIYCDGSCKGNGKKDSVGAWAYVILDSNNEIITSYSYPESNTTNNQMEMKGLIESVKRLEEFCKEKNLNLKDMDALIFKKWNYFLPKFFIFNWFFFCLNPLILNPIFIPFLLFTIMYISTICIYFNFKVKIVLFTKLF